MALAYSKKEELGGVAPDFSLKGVDGKIYSLDSFKESKALVLIFMCNHCPYVIAVQDRINQLAKDYIERGVSVVGINPNDSEQYPDDSFEKMVERSRKQNFQFFYLQDETQEVAKAYGAVCTPDPYVYKNESGHFRLSYHGLIDDHWKDPDSVTQKYLAECLDSILSGQPVSSDQKPAMGCSIKWK